MASSETTAPGEIKTARRCRITGRHRRGSSGVCPLSSRLRSRSKPIHKFPLERRFVMRSPHDNIVDMLIQISRAVAFWFIHAFVGYRNASVLNSPPISRDAGYVTHYCTDLDHLLPRPTYVRIRLEPRHPLLKVLATLSHRCRISHDALLSSALCFNSD